MVLCFYVYAKLLLGSHKSFRQETSPGFEGTGYTFVRQFLGTHTQPVFSCTENNVFCPVVWQNIEETLQVGSQPHDIVSRVQNTASYRPM
jgi:hypothetical protein